MDLPLHGTFPVFQQNATQDANQFVKFWSSLYNYKEYEQYKTAITKDQLSKKDLRVLFEWKYGGDVNTKKERGFLSHVLQHDDTVNNLKKQFEKKKFDKTFDKIPATWEIFLMHILQPTVVPLFDKHVYRAFKKLKDVYLKGLPEKDDDLLKLFNESYMPFFAEMRKAANEFDVFDIDRALWTFGKTLKVYPGLVSGHN